MSTRPLLCGHNLGGLLIEAVLTRAKARGCATNRLERRREFFGEVEAGAF